MDTRSMIIGASSNEVYKMKLIGRKERVEEANS